MSKGFKLIKRNSEYIIELCEGWEKDQFIYKTYEEAVWAL